MTQPPRPTPALAAVAFLLGLASLALFAVTGLPAVLLGYHALRRINASDGAPRGAPLAVAGMALGALGTLATLLGVGSIVVIRLQVASRRLEGVEHLRQLGIALNKHCDLRHAYPPATRDPEALPPERRLSWMPDVLPLLASGGPAHARLEKLAGRVVRDEAWDAPANAPVLDTPVRLFLAPAHPHFDPFERPGKTHFVGVSGVGPDAESLRRDDPRAGVFGDDRGVVRSEISRGTSVTFLLLETAHANGPWLAGASPTVRDVDPRADDLSGPGRPFGGITPGHVEALFVDGSVRSLRDDTPGTIFRAHATLRAP